MKQENLKPTKHIIDLALDINKFIHQDNEEN